MVNEIMAKNEIAGSLEKITGSTQYEYQLF